MANKTAATPNPAPIEPTPPKHFVQSRGVTGSLTSLVLGIGMLASILWGHYTGKGELPPVTYDTYQQVKEVVEAEKDNTEELLISMGLVGAGWRSLRGRLDAGAISLLRPKG